MIYRIVSGHHSLGYCKPVLYAGTYNALVKYPRKRGFKVTPVQLNEKDNMWILGPTAWKPQDKHVLGTIIGETIGPKYYGEKL